MTRESRTYQTRAIVLRHYEFGEADRILRLFTLEKGKISAIAKGVRRISSRKAGHLEPFSQVHLFLASGRDLDIITQAESLKSMSGLRADLHRMSLASYVVELLDRFTYEEGPNPALFRLLSQTLERLEAQENLETAVRYYELRLLELLGYRPQLFNCIDCSAEIRAQDQFFSPLGGGVVCPTCGRSRTEAWPIETDVLRYLRHLQRSDWQSIAQVVIPGEINQAMSTLTEAYFSYLLESHLNTPEFIRKIQGTNDET
ncbi:MAG: DNA repair protein RecO [Chloroflexi bacterium ADurb.Bin120]|jgi:DNA repair protein RecO (recombination protein O)|uniref:DNA repair protein RecO n=1 Tax=Candidatus Brevifilum fermentans TaxID=1986204 RepID=A0A1Y6K3D7_9CHLR|nr:DNA repair protein RecO [Brevefilum fermentans]MDI9567056.1 DNA repair protein RecO [Chloroflexota bacterium]OQB88047.1 MAG: DNA repair protein RecO [Chloroflexi bacterium ADurb.Bin120]SMX53109.1 DNA repair protein RecO [Brevefilum fermentans]HOM67428.1 DNA repair protein RecO [Brevefilum fermentans]